MAKNTGAPTTRTDASRIQSSQAKGGNETGKGSFSSRAQSAAAKNANAGIVPSAGGLPKGGNAKSGGGSAKK